MGGESQTTQVWVFNDRQGVEYHYALGKILLHTSWSSRTKLKNKNKHPALLINVFLWNKLPPMLIRTSCYTCLVHSIVFFIVLIRITTLCEYIPRACFSH